MLSFTISLERFETIARGDAQIRKDVSRMNGHQLPPSPLDDIEWKPSHVRCSEELVRQFVFEISYHDFIQTDRGGLGPNQLQLLPRRLQPCEVIAGMV